MGTAPSSSARVKHRVGVDNKKINGMQNIWDILLKSSVEKLKNGNLPCKDVYSKPSSFAEKQRVADIPYRSSICWHQSKDIDQTRKAASLLGKHTSSVVLREVKCRADPASMTPFEASMVVARKARELSAQAKSSTSAQAEGPKVGKPCSATGDVCVSDALKMNFLSSPSACAKLIDLLHQASDLSTFSNLSLEKQKHKVIALLQK